MNSLKTIIGHDVQTTKDTPAPSAGGKTANTRDSSSLKRLNEDSDKIATLCDMAMRAAPAKIADTWLREASRTQTATELFYSNKVAVVRSVVRNVVHEADFDKRIREGRQTSKHRIDAARSFVKGTHELKSDIGRLERKLVETATLHRNNRPSDLAAHKFSALEKRLLHMIGVSSAIRTGKTVAAHVFPEDFKDAVNWNSTWKHVTNTEALGELRLQLQQVQHVAKSFFAAHKTSDCIIDGDTGSLGKLAAILTSVKDAYPEIERADMQPVVADIAAANDRAHDSVVTKIESDIGTLAAAGTTQAHLSELASGIAKRARKHIENLKQIDEPAADRYSRELMNARPATVSHAIAYASDDA